MNTKAKSKPKNRNNKISFNIPLQVMLNEKINKDLIIRLSQLSKSKADYVRSLIVEDINNSKKLA